MKGLLGIKTKIWLKKNQTCPFCRFELSLKILKEFKKNPIVYKYIERLEVCYKQINNIYENKHEESSEMNQL